MEIVMLGRSVCKDELNSILYSMSLFGFTPHEAVGINGEYDLFGDIYVASSRRFEIEPYLRFCYHEISLLRNRSGFVIWKAVLYYYDNKVDLLEDIKELDYELFNSMDKDNLANNSFIHLNYIINEQSTN